MIIDAHLHVWDLSRARYPWLTPRLPGLRRAIGFDEIEPVLRAHGVDGAVLVQAADEAGDTEGMLATAAAHPEIVGVVAWSPLDEPASLAADLERFAAEPLVVGLRNLVHERPAAWLDRREVHAGLAILAAHGMPLDVPTADPSGLAAVARIGARHPELRIVIDHLGKPPIGGDAEDHARWRRLLAECARNPAAVAKVSGLYGAGDELVCWTVDDVRRCVSDALDLFGPDRLIYGGDWPISELAGGYERVWAAIDTALGELAGAERAAILGGTAIRVYGLRAAGRIR